MCWFSWEKLTQSKNQEGLGFREIQSFNDSLLAKISWRILTNPSSLLSKILIGKYCRDHDFLNVPITSTTSHGWRGILFGRDLLKSQLGRAIGDGQTTSLWNDPWISLDKLSRPMGPPTMQNKDLTVSAILSSLSRDWNRDRIQDLLPHHLNDFLTIRPSKKGARDSYIWLPTKTGDYSVKTGYYASMDLKTEPNQHGQTQPINWSLDIWQAKISPKNKSFFMENYTRGFTYRR